MKSPRNDTNEQDFSFENLPKTRQQNKIALQHFLHLLNEEKLGGDDNILNISNPNIDDAIYELEEEYEEDYQKHAKKEENTFVDLVPMNELEKAIIYQDKYPFLAIRKQLNLFKTHITYNTQRMVKHQVFEMITLTVIIFNSITLALDDPTTSIQTDFQNVTDEIFLAFYAAETLIKILAYGLIFNQGAYLRDAWNILDLTVVITGFLPYVVENQSINLNALRSLRVLRPLRTISSIKALRSIMVALFASVSQLSNAILVLLFTFTVFAISGLQLFMGFTKKRCFIGMTGIIQFQGYGIDEAFCATNTDCPTAYLCGKMSRSPQQDLISFDNFFLSFMQIFVIQTTEGWTDIMQSIQLTFSQFSVVYFMLIMVTINFFLINIMLAIIKINFQRARISNDPIIPEEQAYNLRQLKYLGIYKSKVPETRKITGIRQIKKKQTYMGNERKNRTKFSSKPQQEYNLKFKPLAIMEYSKQIKIDYQGVQLRFEGIQGVNTKHHPEPQTRHSNLGLDFEIERKQKRRSSQIKHTEQLETPNLNLPQLVQQTSNRSLHLSPLNLQDDQTPMVSKKATMISNQDKTPTPRENEFHSRQSTVLNPIENFNFQYRKQQEEDLSSLTFSKQDSISEHQIEEEFDELDIPVDRRQFNQIKEKEIAKPQKQQRLRRRIKELPVLEDVSKDGEKLKIRLYQTKLITRVLNEKQYKSDSQMDILEIKYMQRQLYLQQLREKSLRQIKKRLQYNFSNKVKIFSATAKSNFISQKISSSKVVPLAEAYSAKHQSSQSVYQSIQRSLQKSIHLELTNKPTIFKKNQKEQVLTYDLAKTQIQQVINNIDPLSKNAVQAELEYQQFSDNLHQDSLFYQEYNKLKQKDQTSDYIVTECSYQEVLCIPDHMYTDSHFIIALNSIYRALNYDENDYFIYLAGLFGILKNAQRKLLFIVESYGFLILMNSAVAANTIVLGMNGLVGQSSVFDDINLFFTILFTIELGFKLLANGIQKFMKDSMNLFDASIVAISMVDLVFLSKGGKSQLGAIRAFRALRVLRITKLMRTLPFMKFLISVLSNAFSSLFYTFLLLFLFIYIFTLLGMSFFGGSLTNTDSRLNFDSFLYSFLTVFGVVTLSNWNNILYALIQQHITGWIVVPYLVIWIFVGNYILMNLFISSLLDSFDEEYSKQQEELKQIQQEDREVVSVHSRTNTVMQTFNPQSIKKQDFRYFTEPGLCQYSLFIFSQQNWLRKMIYRLVKNQYFEYLILVVIIISSLKLVVDTYIDRFQPWLNYFFAFFFGIESVLKIIAYGFILNRNSYLRDHWNKLDFIIVICSFIDVFVDQIDLSFVKILRLLRALRPLRLISQNKSMRLLVTTLINSAGGILGVGVVIILTMIMFGILGVNLMSGKLYYCTYTDDIYQYNRKTCPYGYWENRHYNFDDILQAMLSLFILNSLEDWNNYMFYFVDADENGPIKDANQWFIGFFMIYIIIVSFLLINMFVGVILVNYKLAEEESRDKSLSTEQENWLNTLKLIIDSNPNFALYYAPENPYRAFIFKIVSHRYFDTFIMLTIVGNICLLGCYYDDAPVAYIDELEILNLALSFIFIGESAIKMISFGFVGYFRNRSNQFDFFVSLTSFLDFALSIVGTSSSFLKSAPQVVRIFRVLRVSRLFRLVRQFPQLKKLIDTAIFSLPALLNVSVLMFLIFFIMGILGVFLFSDIEDGMLISWLNNFHNFHQALQILFRSILGENWYLFMYDTMGQVGNWSFIYWVTLEVVQAQIMLSLFVLIILDQYEMFYFNDDNPLQRFQDYESDFIEIWAPLASESQGQSIHQRQLINLMLGLKEPLGYDIEQKLEQVVNDWKIFNKDGDDSKQNIQKIKQLELVRAKKLISKKIMQMGLSTDEDKHLEYHYVLFAFMKNFQLEQLQAFVTVEGSFKITQKEEQALSNIRRKRKQQNDVNPCVQLLFVMMCFKAFRRHIEKIKKKKARKTDNEFSEKDSDSSVQWNSIVQEEKQENNSVTDSENSCQPYFVNIPKLEIYEREPNIVIVTEDVKSKQSESQSQESESQQYRFHIDPDKY